MRKFRFRSYLDDSLFVVLIMAAALASAGMEAAALIGAAPSLLPSAMAQARPVAPARSAQAAASSIQVASRGAGAARLTR